MNTFILLVGGIHYQQVELGEASVMAENQLLLSPLKAAGSFLMSREEIPGQLLLTENCSCHRGTESATLEAQTWC